MFKSSSTSSIKQLWLLGISSSSGINSTKPGLYYSKSFKNCQPINGSTIKRFKATALNISETKNEDTKTNYVPTIDQRAKFGHTGKQVQEKIALEVSICIIIVNVFLLHMYFIIYMCACVSVKQYPVLLLFLKV